MITFGLFFLIIGNLALLYRLWQTGGGAPLTACHLKSRRCQALVLGALLLLGDGWLLALPRERLVHLLLAWGFSAALARQAIGLRLILLATGALIAQSMTLIGSAHLMRAIIRRWHGTRARSVWRATLPWALIAALVLGVLSVIMALTSLGIRTHTLNWYESGVPVLPDQLGLVILLTVLGAALLPLRPTLRDGLVAAALWGVAALWWELTPAPPAFFSPGEMPPTGQPYPWSDALSWDLHGWQLLSGWHPAPTLDHMGYSGWLAWLHLWTGANYHLTIALQTVLLAVLPAVVYLIGRHIGSKTAGLAAALLTAAQGANAIGVGERFNIVHPKMLMTEWPTALLLALATWCLLRFPKERRAWSLPFLSGALLGLATMFRFGALAMLPAFAVGYLWLAGKSRWRQGLTALAALLLGAFLVWSPWMLHSQQRAGSPWFFLHKVSYALTPWYRTPAPQSPSPSRQPTPAPSSSPPHATRPHPQTAPAAQSPFPWEIVGQYWLHNLAANFFTLPLALRPYDMAGLWDVHPPLHRTWWYGQRGGLSPLQGLGVALYLMLLAWGLGAAWRRARWAGLVPLGAALAYHLATAVARTGGGRYIVPVQWVLWLYLGLAVADLAAGLWAGLGFSPETTSQPVCPPATPSPSYHRLALAALLAALPIWMVVHDATTSHPYLALTPAQAWAHLKQDANWEQAPTDQNAIQAFLHQPHAAILAGEVYYPRYFAPNQGIPEAHDEGHRPQPFGRLAGYFTFAPRQRAAKISFALPQATPPSKGPWGKAYLIGCLEPSAEHMDVLLLAWVAPQQTIWYSRDPLPPSQTWRCPLPTPP